LSWARAFNGHLADHHQFPFAHTFGRIAASTPISPDIDEQTEARLAPFLWMTIPDNGVRIAGARPGGVLHQKERSPPHPSRWRGAATRM